MNKKKRMLIADCLERFANEFMLKEVTHEEIKKFMERINPMVLEYGHEIIGFGGNMNHWDRIKVKNNIRMIVLQEIGKQFPAQVIEYLCRKISSLRGHA